jgi:aminobenzoyl-glutamate transport protein
VVLPPLAMAIYAAIGRSPMVGLAAVFAGVSAGFNANLLITGLDPLLAGLSTEGAQIIDEGYAVAAPANWYFMIVSTVVITAVGWWTTTRLVAPRFAGKPAEEGGTQEKTDDDDIRTIKPEEKAGLKVAGYTFLVILVIVLAGTLIPGAPLYGEGELFARWVEAIVPLLFVFFIVPGIAYGVAAKTVKGEKQAAQLMVESMAAMAPIIVLSFFAAQFVEYFNESNLGAMMAMSGGEFLASAQLPPILLIITFILVVAVFNLFVGSMSAKYTLFAPIFIPMFMLIGISPELTQAAYRIGDSVSNIITPLNAYLIIILVAMRRYLPKAGMGTLISTMLPYTLTFLIAWTIMLVVWMLFGLPLGPDAPMEYVPSAR